MYAASNLLIWADIIDIHYWKSGEVLWTSFPAEMEKKPKILFHMNPYHADNKEVNDKYDITVVGNDEIHTRVPYAYKVPYGVDTEFFSYNEDYTEEKIVNMVVGRIEGKKGVKQVAEACRDLGYQFRLVGRVSNGEYMQDVLNAGGKNILFIENATENQLRDEYYKAAIHVCNSVDGFESGTLPILEAMASGVPVLTRAVGHVPDLDNGSNMIIRKGEQDDLEDLKKELKQLMENKDLRDKLREKAWDTARNRDIRRMSKRVVNLYKRLYEPDRKLISIIIPTKDNPKSFVDCFVAAAKQDYKKFEIIVADSGDSPVKKIVDEAAKSIDVPITYLHFPHNNNYTLAEARNRAIVEAEGELLVFCDDRLKMEPDAIKQFFTFAKNASWCWGVKDGVAKGFVENFSCIHREDLIKGGMFSERMQWYGGMTQELRQRFELGRGFEFILVDQAKATQIKRARSKKSKRKNIINAKWLVYKMYGE